jgi:hypothetical protein
MIYGHCNGVFVVHRFKIVSWPDLQRLIAIKNIIRNFRLNPDTIFILLGLLQETVGRLTPCDRYL